MRKKYNIRIPKGKEVKNVKTKIVDGNIEVSYDVEDIFNPKYGDFLATKSGRVFIYNGRNTVVEYGAYCGIDIYNKIILLNYFSCGWTGKEGCRYATEQEKSAFLERLEKECKQRWNPETKQLEDIRWIPYHNQEYWYINEDFVPIWDKFSNKNTDHISRIKSNNCFKTEEAAQKVADQIKDIFKNSKAE